MPSRHRHFVMIPLLALGIAVSGGIVVLSQGHASLTDRPWTETSDGGLHGRLISGPDLSGVLSMGGSLEYRGDLPELTDGTLLVSALSPVRIRAAGRIVTAVGGGFHLTVRGDSLTVAALTAPVLVAEASARHVIPAGMQWRSTGEPLARMGAGIPAWMAARALQPLPRRFQSDRVAALMPLSERAREHLPAARTSIPPSPDVRLLPLLEEAVVRERHEWIESVLGALRSRIEAEDTVAVQTMLLDPALSRVFSSPRAQQAAAYFLFAYDASTALQQQLLPLIASDPDLWVLVAVHPKTAAVAWTLGEPEDVTSELVAVRILLFPASDIAGTAGNAVAWERWREELKAFVAHSSDPRRTVEDLLTALAPLVQDREERGYPARARLLAEALRAVARPHVDALSVDAHAAYNALALLDRVNADALEEETPFSAPAQAPVPSPPEPRALDGLALSAVARSVLQQADAAFSVATRIIPVGEGLVQIEGIIFAGSAQDRVMDFLLDLAKGEVREIHDGVRGYPHGMGWEAFVQWAKR
jgi:hypothetical protein